MLEATVRTLTVKPSQSASLAFNMPGIIDYQNFSLAMLGTRVEKFDLAILYNVLDKPIEGTDGLLPDATKIRDWLTANVTLPSDPRTINHSSVIFALRNASLVSHVDQLVIQRQNAWLRRYKHRTHIISNIKQLYDPDLTNPLSKLSRLNKIEESAILRLESLRNEYSDIEGEMRGVVKTTKTTAESAGSSTGAVNTSAVSHSSNETHSISNAQSQQSSDSVETNSSRTNTSVTPLAFGTYSAQAYAPNAGDAGNERPDNFHYNVSFVQERTDKDNTQPPYEDGPFGSDEFKFQQRVVTEPTIGIPHIWESERGWVPADGVYNAQTNVNSGSGTGSNNSKSSSTNNVDGSGASESMTTSDSSSINSSTSTGTTHNRGFEFRHPSAENEMTGQRALVQLKDEQFNQELFSLQVRERNDGTTQVDMDDILENELRVIDHDVRKVQLNYVHTFLVSPITGVVTGVFKDIGESVQVGEAVLQIENDASVLLVGRLNYRSKLEIGMKPMVKAFHVFEADTTDIPLEMEGEIVSIRGHRADNDEWDIVIRCDNRENPTLSSDDGKRKFPLNYTFDRHHTKVVIEP